MKEEFRTNIEVNGRKLGIFKVTEMSYGGEWEHKNYTVKEENGEILGTFWAYPASVDIKKLLNKKKWEVDDLFHKTQKPESIYRIHRIKGTTIWYLGNQYGYSPPRGILQTAHTEDTDNWVKVERI